MKNKENKENKESKDKLRTNYATQGKVKKTKVTSRNSYLKTKDNDREQGQAKKPKKNMGPQ